MPASYQRIGIAEHVQHETSSFDVLKQADLAMYAAKAEGKNRDVASFGASRLIADKAMQRRQSYQSLQYVFLRKEICSCFDCFVACDGRTRELRASPRWARPDGTEIAGADLVDLAVSAGFGVQFGEFQLDDATRRLRTAKVKTSAYRVDNALAALIFARAFVTQVGRVHLRLHRLLCPATLASCKSSRSRPRVSGR
jgi:predicted signal transduction protein with EAL and GGDEF domain